MAGPRRRRKELMALIKKVLREKFPDGAVPKEILAEIADRVEWSNFSTPRDKLISVVCWEMRGLKELQYEDGVYSIWEKVPE